jgi:hypothetical protein
MGGDKIAVVWKPTAFVPKPFKWPDTVDMMPMEVKVQVAFDIP